MSGGLPRAPTLLQSAFVTTAPTQTVLLVEDDPALALGLCDSLEFEGFAVLHAKRGSEAVTMAKSARPDCILLDVMLPDMNGYQVCEAVRAWDLNVPILMLTARSQEADKIRGLDAGADDYVTKPFSVSELMARVRALLRRAKRTTLAPADEFHVGECVVDPGTQELRLPDGQVEQLSFFEVQLLAFLHAHGGQPVSRDDILEKVWGSTGNTRTVDNFIVKLRKKIEPLPEKPRYILTVYGVGYRLAMPKEFTKDEVG
ncbi:MAG: response regulator transcription factor [Sandaracinaceae bacterium]|nr:response regulator transcription factor [Sandaracinaceae bacterium]